MTAVAGTAAIDVDLWAEVIGQPTLVAQLRSTAHHPTHAYLFVGEPGVGTMAAAKAFAAELLIAARAEAEADVADVEHTAAAARTKRLVSEGIHPAVITVERAGASLTADQVRDVVRRAQMRPAEGDRQVIILTEFHLAAAAAPMLLKSIEEPPAGTIFIVLADEVAPDMVTIASRCVRFEFPRLSRTVITEHLESTGVPPEIADAAALGSGGDLDRARLLTTDERVVDRRNFWCELPTRLNGTGARSAQLAAEVMARTEEVLAPLAARHAAELDDLAVQAERHGLKKTVSKDVDARHKREIRRVRADELRAGLAALMDGYRADGIFEANRYIAAGDLVGKLCENLVFNPNEELALQALFVSLPQTA